ncbi:hypothetical protein DCE79_04830 [Lysinibacillus sp. 2017]|uniref:hypothetical protein n=1 Tax=unclassified Lysinibacillus TaxID=2636778 RepID=UPI000D529B26|nr:MULTISPECIES: hypothetical protein [unclassified Lysinibacillus]AWE06761.1 hypothetical protein DCE79_04830 [Lysinibacillus sp. 2017]TGN37307.1 hypothetical protein E4L99_02165 [Lysinibacillus sp. S2017]
MDKIEYKLNQVAVILITMWIAIPLFRVRVGVIFFILLFFLWLITSDTKWLIQKLSWSLLFVLTFFITFIPYVIVGKLQYGAAGVNIIIVNFPLFFVGLFINHYYMFYKKDYKTLGKIAFYFLLFFTIGALQTYFGLLTYPMASRQLATGLPEFSEMYNRMGIGGFGFIYSGTFLLLAILYMFLMKRNLFSLKYKILIVLSIVIISLMLLKASFATSILITFCGVLLILFVRSKLTLVITVLFTVISITFISESLIAKFFLGIANYFSEDPILKEKFTDLASTFLYSSLDGQTGNRFDLYVSSLKVFLGNPFFGIYGPFGDQNASLVGGHSGWFDLLAYYGLFTSIPLFIALYYNFKIHFSLLKKMKFHVYLTILYFLIFVFGLINPILYVYEIGFVLFCIIPAIPFIPYAFKTNALAETKKEKSDQTNEDIMARQYSPARSMSTNG